MPRKFFRKLLPHPSKIHSARALRMFGPALRRPYLWHLNRRSVARAFLIGIFWALVPMPWQMIPAAAFAIFLRANVPLSVALVWLTNPLTMGPIFFATYQFGRLLMGDAPVPAVEVEEAPSLWSLNVAVWWGWTRTNFRTYVAPLYLGSIVSGIFLSTFAYLILDWFWRRNVARRWHRRPGRALPATVKAPPRGHPSP